MIPLILSDIGAPSGKAATVALSPTDGGDAQSFSDLMPSAQDASTKNGPVAEGMVGDDQDQTDTDGPVVVAVPETPGAARWSIGDYPRTAEQTPRNGGYRYNRG